MEKQPDLELLLLRFDTGQASEEEKRQLKRKVRTAMELLIRQDNLEQMEMLEKQGWYGRCELDSFIRFAGEQKKTLSLLWLLHLKNDKYGYQCEDFIL